MTGAVFAARLPDMRGYLLSSALVAALAATPAAAQAGCTASPQSTSDTAASVPLVPIAPEVAPTPAPLAPLAEDSPWRARFEAAADDLLPALQSRQPDRWQPLLGGRWLGETERKAVAALLEDRCGAFAPLLASSAPIERRILGWSLPASYTAAERAAIAARPEAEALVCWSAGQGGKTAWPRTAAEADNNADRPYACVRIAYSMRDWTPSWRAFIERG